MACFSSVLISLLSALVAMAYLPARSVVVSLPRASGMALFADSAASRHSMNDTSVAPEYPASSQSLSSCTSVQASSGSMFVCASAAICARQRVPRPLVLFSRSLRQALLVMHSSMALPMARLTILMVPGSTEHSVFSSSVRT